MRRPRYRNARGQELAAERFDPFQLVVLTTTTAWKTAHMATGVLDAVDNMVRSHANWRIERREFAEAARHDIESMTEPLNPPK